MFYIAQYPLPPAQRKGFTGGGFSQSCESHVAVKIECKPILCIFTKMVPTLFRKMYFAGN